MYSIGEMSDLVDYARARGVKIVQEFDEPAHTGTAQHERYTLRDYSVCLSVRDLFLDFNTSSLKMHKGITRF